MQNRKRLKDDDIADVALNIVDDLVRAGLCPNCTDTDDSTEFVVQDTIRRHLEKEFGYPFREGDDYYTLDALGNLHHSVWDEQSESLHDQNPNKVYYNPIHSENGIWLEEIGGSDE